MLYLGSEPGAAGWEDGRQIKWAMTAPNLAKSFSAIFLNGPSPASFSFIFVFSNKHYNFYNKDMWKNVHPVYSAGIQTHNHQNMSLLL